MNDSHEFENGKTICKEIIEEKPGRAGKDEISQYFEETTVKKAAEIFGCSRKTIQNRRKRILEKIGKMMEEI